MNEIRYRIAELLFEDCLEADYNMGCREGEYVAHLVMVRHLTALKDNSSAAHAKGLDLAIKHIQSRLENGELNG